MGDRTTEKTGRATEAARDPATHPLDAWLRRELRAMYAGCAREPLPPAIAELAARLEESLNRPGHPDLRERGRSRFSRVKQ